MSQKKKKIESVLIKPAGPDCNMACDYCFYLKKNELFRGEPKTRMSQALLEELIRQVMNQTKEQAVFIWQGGEPTLMGLNFYEKAVSFQKKYGRNQLVGNGFQTNGLLIDENWAEFLAKYKFLIGLSLDGPEHVHDHYRKLSNGQGTWKKVLNSAQNLLNSGCEVNALSLISDYSVQFPEEIFNFFRELGLNQMQFIPCVESAPGNPTKAATFSVNPESYGRFLICLFDLWIDSFYQGQPTTTIRYFDSVFYSYLNMTPPQCDLQFECGKYVVVEHNGDVYSCDFFVQPEWKLGNILSDNLLDLLNSEKQTQFGRQKSQLPQSCQDCEWLVQCRGGCTKDRTQVPQKQDLNYFCSSFKAFFQHADAQYKKMAEEWKIRDKQQREKNKKNMMEAIASGQLVVSRNDLCPCGSGMKFKKCCGRTG